jgi:hypothetical protein
MQTVKSFRLPAITLDAIQKQSEIEGISFSQLIKKSVILYLSMVNGTPVKSPFKPRIVPKAECPCLEVHTCGK